MLISDSDERSLQIKIDRVVAELETWLNRKELVINAGKTGVMSFHNRQTHIPVKRLVTLHKMTVDCTAEMKFVGIQIMDKLKWHPHIQVLASKLCKVAFMIKMYRTMILPVDRYGCETWSLTLREELSCGCLRIGC